MREVVALVGATGRWEHAGQRFFDGEVEPCINGRTVAVGAYFGLTSTALWSGCSASSSRMAGGIARPKRLGACIVRDNDLRARGIARARAGDRRFVAGRRGAPQRRAVPARPVVVPTAEHKGVRTGRAAGTIVGHESRRARPTRVHVPLPARRTGPAHPRLRPLRGVRRCLMRIQWPPSQRGGRSTSS